MSKGVQLALGNPQLKTPADLLMVKLDSNGGDLYAAMEIGRAMKAHDTKRNDRAVIVSSDSVCYSSCVFIAAAGLQRLLDGKVGIHRPYAMNPQKSLPESQRWLDKVASDARSYLREMGVVESLYNDMANIPPGELHIFSSQKEMDSYGLKGFVKVSVKKLVPIKKQQRTVSTIRIFFDVINEEIFFPIFKPFLNQNFFL